MEKHAVFRFKVEMQDEELPWLCRLQTSYCAGLWQGTQMLNLVIANQTTGRWTTPFKAHHVYH
jgi:hypothetical protein